jgi:hypothetical protein
MHSIEECLIDAERCHRLARDVDVLIRSILIELAEKYEAKATRLAPDHRGA